MADLLKKTYDSWTDPNYKDQAPSKNVLAALKLAISRECLDAIKELDRHAQAKEDALCDKID